MKDEDGSSGAITKEDGKFEVSARSLSKYGILTLQVKKVVRECKSA